ncbi:MAG: family 43 glycosylhydrolase [Sedimentisphaerales bacterium]|nr:family 43 glycosylhydrolase [Sedimentisphaerales bacterium]
MILSLGLGLWIARPLSGQITILSNPTDQVVVEGQQASFQVTIQTSGPFTASWFRLDQQGKVQVDNERSSIQITHDGRRIIHTIQLVLTNVLMSDIGQYLCQIESQGQIMTSEPARLIVKGLAAHWPLDQGHYKDGLFLDTASGFHVRAVKGPTFTTGPDRGQDTAILAADPNGWGILEPFDMTFGSGVLTICLWIRLHSQVQEGLDGNTPADLVARYIAADLSWHHLSIAYDGNKASIYIDGRPHTNIDTNLPKPEQVLAGIGINCQGTWPFSCEISDIRLYNKVLDISEVACVYEQTACLIEQVDAGARSVHDPAIISADGIYYLFSTGHGIPIRRSRDLVHWEPAGRVFGTLPAWVTQEVPGVSNLWAPDISYRDGRYYLYYSASTFGSNRSCVGLATNVTLDQADPNYRWVDEGKVISSTPASNYNAIDGNVVEDQEGRLWLAFGSFWTGIKLVQLDPSSGKPIQPAQLISIASRPSTAIEAPFIIARHGYYYLFVSFDLCCRGADSTYNIRVGRAKAITGPYYDKDGVPMLNGGGSLVLAADPRWKGPGHNAILQEGDQDYLVYHAYDALNNGASALRIRPLYWSHDLWPLPAAVLRP